LARTDKNLSKANPHARFFNWNSILEKGIRSFVAEKSTADDPVTTIYFSSHKVFTAFLDNPKSHGFPPSDIQKSGGAIWMDHLHPTSAVHLLVANELDGSLSAIPPFNPPVVSDTQGE
jgi:phospholipase/lecithinase/hemolysin